MIDLTKYLFQHQFYRDPNGLLTPQRKWRAGVYAHSHELRCLAVRLLVDSFMQKKAIIGYARSRVDQPTVDQPTVDQPTVDQPTVDELLNRLREPANRGQLKKATRGSSPVIRGRAIDMLRDRAGLPGKPVMLASTLITIAGIQQFTGSPGYRLTDKEAGHLMEALRLPITFEDGKRAAITSVYDKQVSIPVSFTKTPWGGHAHTRGYRDTPGVDNSCTLHTISEVLATLYSTQIADLLAYLADQENGESQYADLIDQLRTHQTQGSTNLLEMHIALLAAESARASRSEHEEAVAPCGLEILRTVLKHFKGLDNREEARKEACGKQRWVITGAVSVGAFAMSASVLIAAVVPAWSAFGVGNVPSLLLSSGGVYAAAAVGLVALVVGVIVLTQLPQYRVPRAPRGRLTSLLPPQGPKGSATPPGATFD